MCSAGEFYRAPPFCAAGCWYHSSLAEALPGCPVHSGEEGLGWHIWVELCLHRTQLCVSLRVKHWEVQRAGLCFQSENLPIDWLHGKILPSVSSQAVLRGVSSVHINQFVSRHVLLVKHTPVFNGEFCVCYSGVGQAGNLVLGISVFCFFETPLVSLSSSCYKCNPWFNISISCSKWN